MTDQQTSRTNITEAQVKAREVLRALVAKWDHGSLDAVGDPEVWDENTGLIAQARAVLAAEPRSDAVTAPDDCLNCGKPIAPTHCQACGECDPTPARAASASVPPLDAGFVSRQWGDMAERLESLWDRLGSEDNQDIYFALDLARRNAAAYAAETPEQGRGDE